MDIIRSKFLAGGHDDTRLWPAEPAFWPGNKMIELCGSDWPECINSLPGNSFFFFIFSMESLFILCEIL